ncbi:MAG: hypothetical protein EXS05_10200 [Planctomycetaceae bacterium]|nr:hypothetical protein [Planctomycetaceae bacterium]
MSDRLLQPRVSTPGAGVVSDVRQQPRGPWLLTALVVGVFALCSTWRTPVPGVNEPHYLTKSRHFWDRGWCDRDLFLRSADVHVVFYATIGAVTQVLSFEKTAWVGRVLVWLSLAAGWVALGRQIAPGRWGPAWAAAFFVGLAATGSLSGEWLVGGVEAKGFAYAGLLLGLACASRNRWVATAMAFGGAVSFHPVVGGWGAIALGFALLCLWLGERPIHRQNERGDSSARTLLKPLLVFGLCSLPGMIPALALVLNQTPASVLHAADEIQVFYRLNHHLDPARFTAMAWWGYAALLIVWLGLRPWRRSDAGGRLFFWFVIGTLLIASGGIVVGFGPRWAGALKFYPFRLADLFLPIAVAFELSRFVESRIGHRNAGQNSGRVSPMTVAGHTAAVLTLVWMLCAPGEARNPTGWTDRQNVDWIDVCRWMAANTSGDALCLTPRQRNYTFKWHAGRAEYATWKDCPQDAPHLVEWRRRLDEIRRWRTKHGKTGFDAAALAELRRATEIDYFVAWYVERVGVPPVYRNGSFRVYRLESEPRGP